MTQERMLELKQNPEIQELVHGQYAGRNANGARKAKRTTSGCSIAMPKKGQIVFVGSSLMEWFRIAEMQLTLGLDRIIYNRGIAGTTTGDLLSTMNECILDLEPSKLFINIGSNDIGAVGGLYSIDNLLGNYSEIMDQIKNKLSGTEVFVMAYYPVNAKADFGLDRQMKDIMFATRTNENILKANKAVEELAKQHGFNFIDVNGRTDRQRRKSEKRVFRGRTSSVDNRLLGHP